MRHTSDYYTKHKVTEVTDKKWDYSSVHNNSIASISVRFLCGKQPERIWNFRKEGLTNCVPQSLAILAIFPSKLRFRVSLPPKRENINIRNLNVITQILLSYKTDTVGEMKLLTTLLLFDCTTLTRGKFNSHNPSLSRPALSNSGAANARSSFSVRKITKSEAKTINITSKSDTMLYQF